jgi:hypothetical protein
LIYASRQGLGKVLSIRSLNLIVSDPDAHPAPVCLVGRYTKEERITTELVVSVPKAPFRTDGEQTHFEINFDAPPFGLQ